MTTVDDTLGAMFADPRAVVRSRRRVRGIRLTALPSWPLLSQLGGGAAVLSGAYLLWGVAVTLIIGGVVAVGLGTLREGGKI